ncbi:hypothetical protein [Vibrio coralliilyticus]|uniref:hypothetical protein n=1 Tax=Vibrio coralliilyticus TaxID=190893 RepID=UPI0006CCBD8E|nr:hypothetical protein [Vibrio coralliilyticus]AXN34599.1 hypothetical protein DVV14_25200 [Vibrio coralliilyticus]KPH25202.1 hypothetical protein ADU60_17150 [Vibrio coralliilyticus]
MDTFESLLCAVKQVSHRPHKFMTGCIKYAVINSDKSVFDVFYGQSKDIELDSPFQCLDYCKHKYSKLSVKYHSFILFNMNNTYIQPAINQMSFNADILPWFHEEGIDVGKHLIVDHIYNLMDAKGFNTELLLSEVVEKCKTPPFKFGFDAECDAIGNQLPMHALIDFIDYLDPSGDTGDDIVEYWSKIGNRIPSRKEFITFNWIEGTDTDFVIDSIVYKDLKPYVSNAINKSTMKSKGTWFGVKTTYTYGEKVCRWVDSDNGPEKYNLRSKKSINNTRERMNDPSPPHGH